MKIDKNKYPFVEKLEKNRLGQINIPEEYRQRVDPDKMKDEILDIFISTKKIQFMSKSIFDIILRKEVQSKMIEHKELLKDCAGILIANKNQYLYRVIRMEYEGGVLDHIGVNVYCFDQNFLVGYETFDITKEKLSLNTLYSWSILDPAQISKEILNMLLFLQFAEIETKIIDGSKNERKLKTSNDIYFNETNSIIEIIDSNYFTNIQRTEGFKVTGHFRLQPCGEGMKDRKLIWINDFQKEGYTRKAGILKEQE